jgi:hypothetical protein
MLAAAHLPAWRLIRATRNRKRSRAVAGVVCFMASTYSMTRG